MTGQKLERLHLVTGLVLKQSQQALGLLTAKIADIDSQIARLEQVPPPAGPDLATARAGVSHSHWACRRRHQLHLQKKPLLREAERLRQQTALASGRDRALQALVKADRARTTADLRSRAEREGRVPDL